MTHPRTRSSKQRLWISRRLGIIPGRRFALAAAFGVACLAGAVPAARADQTVVTATIYSPSQRSVTAPSLSLSSLQGCTPYSGGNPIYLYPGGTAYQLPATSWTLDTVLTCGLHLPAGDVSTIQVARSPAYQGFEAPLTSAQLTDPGQFHDPQAPGALPAISVDSGANQNTYSRPWLGASDENARDQVIQQGTPIQIAVYESGQPLAVHISWTAKAAKVKFAATAHATDGSGVPASALSWQWSFGDGSTSRAATPAHSFAAGSYPVAVQVSDTAAGTGGTDTRVVTVSGNSPASGDKNRTGAGSSNKPKSATGPNRSGGHRPGGSASNANGSGTPNPAAGSHGTAPGTGQPRSQATTGRAPAVTSSSTSPAVNSAPGPRRQSRPERRRTRSVRRPAPRTVRTNPRPPLVSGLLVSDVTPLPPGASPLVGQARSSRGAAPPVRRATSASPLPALAAGLAVTVLLGLGAGQELRGRRDWRALRFGA